MIDSPAEQHEAAEVPSPTINIGQMFTYIRVKITMLAHIRDMLLDGRLSPTLLHHACFYTWLQQR